MRITGAVFFEENKSEKRKPVGSSYFKKPVVFTKVPIKNWQLEVL